MKVFLGGTCNGTEWRGYLKGQLEANDLDYFDPVVEDWTPECQEIEEIEKEDYCDVHLYYLTSAMTGVFSIAEVVDSAHRGFDTIFLVNPEGFDEGQIKSFKATMKLVSKIGGSVNFDNGEFVDTIDMLCELRDNEDESM